MNAKTQAQINRMKEQTIGVEVEMNNITAFVYIMHEERSLGIPSLAYIRTCEEGYRNFGFDSKFLDAAYEISAKEVQR